MIPASVSQIDFATLKTLQLVYRLKSFSAAANELGVNQSGVSYTIDKLRKALDDPLFVRQGGGIAPTARCIQAMDSAEHILAEAERLSMTETFDPSTADGVVKISAGYLIRSALMGPFLRRLRREAPGLKLYISAEANVEKALFNDIVDVAISPATVEMNGVYKQVVYRTAEATVMDASNPLAEGTLTLERFLEAEHIMFDLGGNFRQFWVQALDTMGHKPKIAVTTSDGMDIPNLVRGTNLIATSAKDLFDLLPDGLVVRLVPYDVPIVVNMHWTAAMHRSPRNKWIRQLLLDCAAERTTAIDRGQELIHR